MVISQWYVNVSRLQFHLHWHMQCELTKTNKKMASLLSPSDILMLGSVFINKIFTKNIDYEMSNSDNLNTQKKKSK